MISRAPAALALAAVLAGGLALPAAAAQPSSPAADAVRAATPTDARTARETKEIALALVSTAENSTTNWRSAYGYLEDIGDGRGLTGGIVGFCSGTQDMETLLRHHVERHPDSPLAAFLPALKKISAAPYGQRPSLSQQLLGERFARVWKSEAAKRPFQESQERERDRVYFNPALAQATKDGVGPLGLAVLYDVSVNHGPGTDSRSFGGIVSAAAKKARPPARGGSEKAYLTAILDVRDQVLRQEGSYQADGRSSMFRQLLRTNPTLTRRPVTWSVYGDAFSFTPRA